jgi:hypothetical protein
MNEPTQEQFAAAKHLNVLLYFGDAPLAVARLCEIVADLTKRIEELETQKWSWLRK